MYLDVDCIEPPPDDSDELDRLLAIQEMNRRGVERKLLASAKKLLCESEKERDKHRQIVQVCLENLAEPVLVERRLRISRRKNGSE